MKLIVARWQESMSWCSKLNTDIVQKGVHLPNVGREPTSFLWWIVENYSSINPEDSYFFVQGNPFDHYPLLLDQLQPVDVFKPLGTWELVSDADGGPHHFEVPVKEYYDEFIGEFPGGVTFWAGGQFAVPGAYLLSYCISWYTQLYNKLMADKRPHAPHALERLWPSIFTRTVRRSSND